MNCDEEVVQLVNNIAQNPTITETQLDEWFGSIEWFINNSVIGTSKFLHFLRPDQFPIVDRFVAYAFRSKYVPQYLDDYVAYRSSVLEYAAICPVRLRRLADAYHMGQGTIEAVRAVELALILYGKHRSRP